MLWTISFQINDTAKLMFLSWNAYMEWRLGDTLLSCVIQFNLFNVFVWKWVVFFSILFLSDFPAMTAGKFLPGSFLNLALWEVINWNGDFWQNPFNLLGQDYIIWFHCYLLFCSLICVLSFGLSTKVMDTSEMIVETRMFSEL